MHAWDIRQPHEPDVALSPLALPVLLAALPEMEWRLLTQRRMESLDGTYAFQAGSICWALHLQRAEVRYEAGMPMEYAAYLTADAESMILLTLEGATSVAIRIVRTTVLRLGT